MSEPIKPMVLPEDWPEDFAHENGCYLNRCCVCSREFRGHKRRATCKACTVTEPIKLPPVPDVIRLYVPQTCFPADWRPPSPGEQKAAPTVAHIATYRLQLWRDGNSEWYEGTHVEMK
jgi:hypothetical protein